MTLKEKLLTAKTSNALFDSLSELDRKKNQELAHISAMIRKKRREKKMSQAELANILNVSQPVISKIESGEENISIERLTEVADALGCDLNIDMRLREPQYEARMMQTANVIYVPWLQEWNKSGDEVRSN